jgi:large subunit ribosomal protein L30
MITRNIPETAKTITVEQVKSATGRKAYQRQTLIGLGLNKLHKVVKVQNTPNARGRIEAVAHLVTVKGWEE